AGRETGPACPLCPRECCDLVWIGAGRRTGQAGAAYTRSANGGEGVVGSGKDNVTRRSGEGGIALRAICVLLCLAGLLAPVGVAAARTPRLVAAFAGRTPSTAARHAVSRLHLRIGRPVFRDHRDWNI